MWPCCAEALGLFCILSTQWRIGPTGRRTGLDYTAAVAALQLQQVPAARWAALHADLAVLERAALKELSKS